MKRSLKVYVDLAKKSDCMDLNDFWARWTIRFMKFAALINVSYSHHTTERFMLTGDASAINWP
jgi:hypothetical protein